MAVVVAAADFVAVLVVALLESNFNSCLVLFSVEAYYRALKK